MALSRQDVEGAVFLAQIQQHVLLVEIVRWACGWGVSRGVLRHLRGRRGSRRQPSPQKSCSVSCGNLRLH